MAHPSKKCDPCGVEFTPPEYMTAEQAALTLSCSHGCASARSNGFRSGPGRRNGGTRGGDAVGGLEYDYKCGCAESCAVLAQTDRSALIAATAARLGMGIVPPGTPRKPLKPADLSRIAAKIRKNRRESYEPENFESETFEAIL